MKLERWGWYSMAVNVVLAGISLLVALGSGSLAVKAEILHNIVDLLTAVAIVVGLRISTRKSKKFPYGLYKVENFVAVIMAMMIFLTAYEIARHAILTPESQITVTAWHLVALITAMIIALGFSFLELRTGKRHHSPSLIADAKEYQVHLLTTGTVLVAFIGQKLGVAVDRLAAIVVVLVIVKTGWDLLLSGVRVLLDASLEPETLMRIREMMLSEPTVGEVKWVTGRNAGRVRFVEAELVFRVSTLEKAERASRKIEEKVIRAIPNIERVLLQVDSSPRAYMTYGMPLRDRDAHISEHFGEAPYFVLLCMRVRDGHIEHQEILPNPHLDVEKARGIRVAEWLVQKKVDQVLIKDSLKGKGPEYVFGDAGVQVAATKAELLSDALAEIRADLESI